jgi:hypothetical protein
MDGLKGFVRAVGVGGAAIGFACLLGGQLVSASGQTSGTAGQPSPQVPNSCMQRFMVAWLPRNRGS